MEQQNFRVKLSLGTKLVLWLTLLFLIIVGFLSYSAVKLVVDDKQAYTFQLQSMEAYIAGQDFSEKTRPAIDNLRLYLTTFDPRLPITSIQMENLKNLVNSQTESGFFTSYFVKPDGTATLLTANTNAEALAKAGFNPDALSFDAAFFKKIRDRILQNSFAFQSYVKPGATPLLIVAFGDLGLKDYEKGMPIGLAVLDARTLITNSRFGETTITTWDGRVLASTNPAKLYEAPDASGHPVFQSAAASKLGSGTKEFDIDGKIYLGAFRKLPIGPIIFTQLEKRKAMAAAFTLGERLGLMGIISVIGAILFALIFSSSITKPLKNLTLATAAVARGEFNIDPKVKTKDEVGQLANSFSIMSRKIQELVVGEVHKAHMEEELKVAAAVQESLIPPPEYRDDHFEIIGSYQSASECGGDWWGFFRIKNKLCVMIADATGHGVPSALITASARSCFSVLAKMAREKESFQLNPGEMMSYTNRVVFDAAMTKIMMTFFIGVIDLDTKTITYANAGHNPPWLFRRNGERFQLKSLVPKGTRVGEREESGMYEEMSAPMDVGDILFLYTDGLMENTSPGEAREQYGKKRAKQVVEEALPGGPRGIIDALKASYTQYNGDTKALDDDVTLASIRIHANPA
ncbi:MAG: SpoIIE family protein phosphatase [Bdellovibrionales bacterium]|nr:SpoIIE family protein phosphatase [Bdellovibrionales bacterium]